MPVGGGAAHDRTFRCRAGAACTRSRRAVPAPFGHLSIREHPRDEAILILRHLHDNPTPFTNIDASHITKIDLEGEPLEAVEGPGQRFIHTAIYRRRADVACVLHYHSHLTAALSLGA